MRKQESRSFFRYRPGLSCFGNSGNHPFMPRKHLLTWESEREVTPSLCDSFDRGLSLTHRTTCQRTAHTHIHTAVLHLINLTFLPTLNTADSKALQLDRNLHIISAYSLILYFSGKFGERLFGTDGREDETHNDHVPEEKKSKSLGEAQYLSGCGCLCTQTRQKHRI